MKITEKITITNEDNMELMARYPDNYFDLAIVDPPYGLGAKLVEGGKSKKRRFNKNLEAVKWDEVPSTDYFNELFRVSKNQIIWGSNYFDLPPTRCNIIWDKKQTNFTGADFELAWTSFDKASKAFRLSRVEAYTNGKIHPTQKPVALYTWLLDKYAKHGDKILDTHLGSGSIAIACYDYGFELTACELDEDYYNDSINRIKNHVSQLKIFQ
ncbi:modification methylase [Chryseobacterium sp. StRB126]|uniref:DNA methyltransferase n=1 Tax=Chryseobacterium sp. StRB126 TaxID=878220 RepID=UPI0004E99CA1|nr:DNA methyltransferase [Chryseobacterium sp. StRB126]BAP30097.1 modification methylase [Chryseobacterium sp. StRB126]